MHHQLLRNHRRTELQRMVRSDPLAIIGRYRVAAGIGPIEPLPRAVTVSDMIESILNHEESDSRSSGVLRAIAG